MSVPKTSHSFVQCAPTTATTTTTAQVIKVRGAASAATPTLANRALLQIEDLHVRQTNQSVSN